MNFKAEISRKYKIVCVAKSGKDEEKRDKGFAKILDDDKKNEDKNDNND